MKLIENKEFELWFRRKFGHFQKDTANFELLYEAFLAGQPHLIAKIDGRGEYFGENCPEGMIQIEFVACSPENRIGNYGWKPEKHAFIEIWIDGKRFRVDVGDYTDGHSTRRGLHIVGPIDLQVEKPSINACSIWLEESY